jgi:hypothetical protein
MRMITEYNYHQETASFQMSHDSIRHHMCFKGKTNLKKKKIFEYSKSATMPGKVYVQPFRFKKIYMFNHIYNNGKQQKTTT